MHWEMSDQTGRIPLRLQEPRLPTSSVSGLLQDAGRFHNAFVSVFQGKEVPDDRLEIIDTLEYREGALRALDEGMEAYGSVVIHFVPNGQGQAGGPVLHPFRIPDRSSGSAGIVSAEQPTKSLLALLRRHFPLLHRMLTRR